MQFLLVALASSPSQAPAFAATVGKAAAGRRRRLGFAEAVGGAAALFGGYRFRPDCLGCLGQE